MTRAALGLRALVAALVVAPGAAVAQPVAPAAEPAAEEGPMGAEARAHLERGLEHYRAKRFAEAIDELRAGYALEPRRELLFAWAQAERLSGDCPSAVLLYQKFLDAGPSPQQAEAARGNLERCEAALSTRPEGAPADGAGEPGATAPSGEAASRARRVAPPGRAAPGSLSRASRRPPGRRWYRDPLADTLAVLGTAGLGVGAFLFVASRDDEASARGAASYAEFERLTRDAEAGRRNAGIAGSVGAALLAGAALRWALSGGGSVEPAVALAVDGAGGAALVVAGGF